MCQHTGRFRISMPSSKTALFFACVVNLNAALGLQHDNASDAVESLHAYAKFKAGEYQQAREIWQRLADRGNTTALINLANLFQQGMGVEPNPKQALDLIRQAAALGDARAQYELGIEYEKGRLVKRDLQQAAHWLLQSALQENADGQFAYGILLATAFGQGLSLTTEHQRNEALEWLKKAQANGHPDARPYIQLLQDFKKTVP